MVKSNQIMTIFRLRVVSKYMPPLSIMNKKQLVNPDLSYYFIDFDKMNVTMPNGKKTVRFRSWREQYQKILALIVPSVTQAHCFIKSQYLTVFVPTKISLAFKLISRFRLTASHIGLYYAISCDQ